MLALPLCRAHVHTKPHIVLHIIPRVQEQSIVFWLGPCIACMHSDVSGRFRLRAADCVVAIAKRYVVCGHDEEWDLSQMLHVLVAALVLRCPLDYATMRVRSRTACNDSHLSSVCSCTGVGVLPRVYNVVVARTELCLYRHNSVSVNRASRCETANVLRAGIPESPWQVCHLASRARSVQAVLNGVEGGHGGLWSVFVSCLGPQPPSNRAVHFAEFLWSVLDNASRELEPEDFVQVAGVPDPPVAEHRMRAVRELYNMVRNNREAAHGVCVTLYENAHAVYEDWAGVAPALGGNEAADAEGEGSDGEHSPDDQAPAQQ
jgi:hypothetical protein